MALRTQFHAVLFGAITLGTGFHLCVWWCAFFLLLAFKMMFNVQTGPRL